MEQFERLLFLRGGGPLWKRYLSDGSIGVMSAFAVTGIIYLFHLYPQIPNISLLYLLVVWILATTCGLYASLVASLVAFLTFDFFLIEPLYTFTITRPEEWLALFFFLATAMITGLVASKLRQSVDDANLREQEARVLYDLVRATTNEDDLPHQLDVVAHALVATFTAYGIRECSIFLPADTSKAVLQASTCTAPQKRILSADEEGLIKQAMMQGKSIDMYDVAQAHEITPGYAPRVIIHNSAWQREVRRYVRIVPLKIGSRVIGLVYLRIENDPDLPAHEKLLVVEPIVSSSNSTRIWTLLDRLTEKVMGVKREQVISGQSFFLSFLDQTAAIIERARLHQENLQVEVLQRTDALRASLLSSVSHDLRTPLSSIKAAASSLQQKDIEWDEEARQSFATTIEREADRLNRFVGNLLDMSRIEGGALKPEKEWYPIDELLHDVLQHMQFPLNGRDVKLDIPEHLPPVELDYLQIDQVVTNLIENAIRYTPAGSPLEISAEASAQYVTISVSDHGPGIPLEDKERIFDKFYRVLGKSRKGTTGSGLGLAVCRGLIEAHGGRIWVDNRDGGGAIFRFTLPLGVVEGKFVA